MLDIRAAGAIRPAESNTFMHCCQLFFEMHFVPVRKRSIGILKVISQHINVSKYADITGMIFRRTVFASDTCEKIYCNNTTHTKWKLKKEKDISDICPGSLPVKSRFLLPIPIRERSMNHSAVKFVMVLSK